jgi:hypothetical protein
VEPNLHHPLEVAAAAVSSLRPQAGAVVAVSSLRPQAGVVVAAAAASRAAWNFHLGEAAGAAGPTYVSSYAAG